MVDIDSKIPNLALMHISTWRKQEGIKTGFNIPDPSEIWVSCVFKKNKSLANGIRFLYPNAKIDMGGSGIDLKKSLPDEVNLMMPDYSLYGCEYDLGFTSRGCNRNCYFCIVHKKEGNFHIVQHPSEFHDHKHKSIVLLDNNILFDKDWFLEVTDWILKQNLKVDFNQGLDVRLIDNDIAKRLKELRPLNSWHFAFDNMDYMDAVINGIDCLNRNGVDVRHRSNWYVYIHDDASFNDALNRCQILREKNALPYLMINQEAKRTQRMTDLKRWCRPQIFFSVPFDQYKKSTKVKTL